MVVQLRRKHPYSYSGIPSPDQAQGFACLKTDLDKNGQTRLWLGPLASGYLISDKRNNVIFARNATRVFAHSHDFLSQQDRKDAPEPNVLDRIFINWWNDHYEEIARYEPEYERLNQIMKWGVVVSWLDLQNQGGLLAPLDDRAPDAVTVVRTNYFPSWKDRHRNDLTFQGWDAIQFDRQDKSRGENEALEILKSEEFPFFKQNRWCEGGATLSSRVAVRESAELSEGLEAIAPSARRAGLAGTRSSLTAGRLETIDATSYEFNNFQREAVATLARAKPSARLTDIYGELGNVGFQRTIRSTSDGIVMSTRTQAEKLIGEFGELRIAERPDGFAVGWQSRDVDLGQSLARQVSVSKHPIDVLTRNPEIETSIELDSGNRGWLVKMRGGDRWIKLVPAQSEEDAVSAGFHAHVAGIGDDAQPIDVAWLDSQGAQNELRSEGYIEVVSRGDATGGVHIECCPREPPNGAQEFTVSEDGIRIRAFRDGEGHTFIGVNELPPSLRADPARLAGIRRLSADDLRLAHHVDASEYREVVDELIHDPEVFRARMDRILADEIERNNLLIANNEMHVALEHNLQLIQIHGHLPELTYRQALLEAGTGNPDGAASALNASFRRPIPHAEKFFDEVNTRLASAKTQQEIINTHRIAQFADWNAQPGTTGEVFSVSENGLLQLEFRPGVFPKGRILSPSEADAVIAQKRAIYVPDRPGFNNLDPYTPSGSGSLRQMISQGRVRFEQVRWMDVSHYKPALIRDADVTFKLSNSSQYTNELLSHGTQYWRNPPDRCDDHQQDCYVYIVSEAGQS